MRIHLGILALALSVATPAAAAGGDELAVELETALANWTHRDPLDLRQWAVAMASACGNRRECILLASQAHVETRWVDWAVDQQCNDPTWRASRRGWERKACDAGHAYGPWQVHDPRFAGASPEFQATVTLQMMRAHPELWTTSAAARSHAEWWLRLHP